jgi:hypothetical protein
MSYSQFVYMLISRPSQLGVGNTVSSRPSPLAVPGFSVGTLAVAIGDMTTCALLYQGAVSCFGYNYYGQVRFFE